MYSALQTRQGCLPSTSYSHYTADETCQCSLYARTGSRELECKSGVSYSTGVRFQRPRDCKTFARKKVIDMQDEEDVEQTMRPWTYNIPTFNEVLNEVDWKDKVSSVYRVCQCPGLNTDMTTWRRLFKELSFKFSS